MTDTNDYRGMTADIIGHYVSHNRISAADLPALIASVHGALAGTSKPPAAAGEKPAPAVPLRKAVSPEAITCLTCGRRFKAIRRHLQQAHEMSPAQYREYWALPKDSPMVAPNYSEARSGLAKAMGLGAGGRSRPQNASGSPSAGRDAPPPSDYIAPVAPPKRRGRAPKTA